MNCTDKYLTLAEKYHPSEPCSCEVCVNYCRRPGWWTIKEAESVLNNGLGYRMMLELSPDFTFGVLSPAFKGNEGNFALQIFSHNGCTFFKSNLCELHNTGLQPLECKFCHHSRKGEGIKCHLDIEREWNSAAGQELVKIWARHFHIRFH
jgi:hypothetical protein